MMLKFNIDDLYTKYNPLLLKLSNGREFVQILGNEDAYQEACLAFMETIRAIEAENPELLDKPSFPGYLKNCITNHLIDKTRHEKLFQNVEFDEAYLSPSPSFEYSVLDRQYLDELEQFLIEPQIMILKADLNILGSKIIYQIYKLELTEIMVAKNLGISQPYVVYLKQQSLRKLRVYLERHKF